MDTQKRDKIIDSWPNLLALAEQYHDGWIFRGEADPRHERLIPKAGRVSEAYGSPRKVPYKAADEIKALKEFRAMAQPYLGGV